MRIFGYRILGPLLFLLSFGNIQAQGVSGPEGQDDTESRKALIAEWIANVYTFGVSTDSDTMLISSEVRMVMDDADLRAYLYPEEYSWETALQLMNAMQLKRAFWVFINLYQLDDQRELVMRTLISYDALFEMDTALLSSFYTYGMLDPEVSDILPNGEVRITRPDIIETKLRTVKEMITYIQAYRTYLSGE